MIILSVLKERRTMIYDLLRPRFWEILDAYPPPHILRHFDAKDRMRIAGPDSDYLDFPDLF